MVELTRRSLLRAGGLAAITAPVLLRQPAIASAPAAEQVHLTFGADAAREMTVSWTTAGAVRRPRVRLGSAAGGHGTTVEARTRTYTDHATGRRVVTHHAALPALAPSTSHVYEVLHDGAAPVAGTFRTAPVGRAPFRFTSFGDQGIDSPTLRGGTRFSSEIVGHIEAQQPLFNLINGDLAYSDLNSDPGAAWDAWFWMNEASTRHRPWMPAAGNHENETGNGPTGYRSFTTRYALPSNGLGGLEGHFYAFTVGAVRFVVLQNDDVCFQNAGNFYVRGYSGGAQKRWLDQTLAAARADRSIDWVVVVMHQLVMSSAWAGNGCDRGVREEFAPLFDKHGVDLVLCGHDHDYERTHPVRGVDKTSATLTPAVAATRTDVVDTTKGTVHMVLGGGGSYPLNVYGGQGPVRTAKVITGKAGTDVEMEVAPWSAVTDPVQAFGFAAFDVDPGTVPGGLTRMKVTAYRSPLVPGGTPTPYDVFTLQRPRSDGRH
ncbi:MAG: metallophosphoesterase [Actinomycetia bacterium]|nr:metallophosphoesterase [Actinomycetes bacterium]